jgi:hypothetical protein
MIYYYTTFPQYEITDIIYGLYAVVMLIDVNWGHSTPIKQIVGSRKVPIWFKFGTYIFINTKK